MHNVQNAMFAAVMAYAMGVKVENIRQGLRTFDTSYFQVPGRTNVFDELPFKVILDYGHNPAAVQAMADLVAAPRVQRAAHLRALRARRSPRRGHPRHRAHRGQGVRSHHRPPRRRSARPRARRGAAHDGAELSSSRAHAARDTTIPDEQAAIQAALSMPARRPPLHLRRQGVAELEASHLLQARGRRGALEASGVGAARTAQRSSPASDQGAASVFGRRDPR